MQLILIANQYNNFNLHCFLWTFLALIQLQWRKDYNRIKQLAVAEDTNIQYFTIAFWNHLKYLNYLYAVLYPHPSFCLCLLCCVLVFLLFIILSLTDTGFTFFLWSTVEKPTHNHLLISAQIPAPPSVWMVLTFDFFFLSSLLLMLRFRHAVMSHTHLSFQCKCFHFSRRSNG